MGGTGIAIINLVRDSFLKEIELRGIVLARNLAFSAVDPLMGQDDLTLTLLARDALRHQGSVYAYILDTAGRAAASPAILTPTGKTDSLTTYLAKNLWNTKIKRHIKLPDKNINDDMYMSSKTTPPQWLRDLYQGDTLTEKGQLKPAPKIPWEYIYEIAVPVVIMGESEGGKKVSKKLGEIHVGIDLTSLQIASRRIQMVVGGITILGVLIGILGAFGLGTLLVRPLRTLVQGVTEIGRGNFDFRIRKRTNDEIGDLTIEFNKMAKDLKDKVLIEDAFKRYVSHQVADEILKDPDVFAKTLKGVKKPVTAFFGDIRGFTSISEKLPPEEVVAFLNFYLTEMTTIIFQNEGTIDKFMGDCIMAIFGAPVEHGDDVFKAVKSAVEIQRKVEQMNRDRLAQGQRDIHVGIGINYGEAVVGNIGSTQRLEYTVIGDSVNTASRLQTLAKGGEIVVSDSVYKKTKEKFEYMAMDPVTVKGKKKVLTVWKIKLPIYTVESYPDTIPPTGGQTDPLPSSIQLL